MARPKKTDDADALMQALFLFWEHGFHGVGTRALEDQTGLTRFTLQTTYGGKKALFLKALDQYLDFMEQVLLPPMVAGGLEALAAWFAGRPIPDDFQAASLQGCMMVNSISEFPRSDQEINARATRFFTMMRGALVTALEGAAEELPEEFDVATAREVLLGNLVAINITAKSPSEGCETLGAATAALIRSWKV